MQWGRILITLLLPLLAALWMGHVIKRKSEQMEAASPYGLFTRGVYYVFGFFITCAVATYLGLYLYSMQSGGIYLASYASIYIGGLWGALVPYRMLARAGKRSAWVWLGLALLYAFLFYLLTEITR
jgi:hypothetical protein